MGGTSIPSITQKKPRTKCMPAFATQQTKVQLHTQPATISNKVFSSKVPSYVSCAKGLSLDTSTNQLFKSNSFNMTHNILPASNSFVQYSNPSVFQEAFLLNPMQPISRSSAIIIDASDNEMGYASSNSNFSGDFDPMTMSLPNQHMFNVVSHSRSSTNDQLLPFNKLDLLYGVGPDVNDFCDDIKSSKVSLHASKSLDRTYGYNEGMPKGISETLLAFKTSVPTSEQKLRISEQMFRSKPQKDSTLEPVKQLKVKEYPAMMHKSHSIICHDEISADEEDDDLEVDFPVVRRNKLSHYRRDDLKTRSLCLPTQKWNKSNLSLDIVKSTDFESSYKAGDDPYPFDEPIRRTEVNKPIQKKLQKKILTKTCSAFRSNDLRLQNKDQSNTICNSSESIKAIIDDVRAVLLREPTVSKYLSDESPSPFTDQSHSEMNLEKKKKNTKETIEGKIYGETKPAVPIEHDNSIKDTTKVDKVPIKNPDNCAIFSKCRSYSNSTHSGGDDSGSDDVFESPRSRAKRSSRFMKRRSSSLDALNSIVPFPKLKPKSNQNRSSVSINNKPEYFEYVKSPNTPTDNDECSTPSRIANYASLFPKNASSSSHGVALLRTSPKRTSLKRNSSTKTKSSGTLNNKSTGSLNKKSTNKTTSKTTKSTKSPKSSTTSMNIKQKSTSDGKSAYSSDYDVRDRGRGRNGNGGGRDSYRDNRHRSGTGGSSGGGGSDREADRSLSDREQRDSHRGSFNRSLSNAEATPEDKIGMCL